LCDIRIVDLTRRCKLLSFCLLSRVFTVVQYAVLEAIRVVYGIW